MFAKVIAKPGERERLLQLLLQASREPMPGCETYIVNVAPSEPNAVFVYEVWRNQADHDASLQIESVKALIGRARPLVESFEGVKMDALEGRGLAKS
jgi:quinol monooxygenase YgiN